MQIQCRISKSLGGGFSGTPNEVWGTVDYTDRVRPTVFFGMYDLRDYIALWRHKGKAWILWCGGDLHNLERGFVLNDGKLKWLSMLLPGFKFLLLCILKKAEHWVENIWEASVLKRYGIKYQICPSFLGDVKKYPKQKKLKKDHFWCSASEGRQKEYGWDCIEIIAPLYSTVFHLYGASWKTIHDNVIVHGKVPIEQMDKETKKMAGSLRFNEKDGFSEVSAKAILWGQQAQTVIPYPFKTRKELLKVLNKYPWNIHAKRSIQ